MSNQDLFTVLYLGAPVVAVAMGAAVAWWHIRQFRRDDAIPPRKR